MAYPTSRKKYYLELDINPQWTDSVLIPDLYDFITTKSSQSIRDIFIEHSERIGYFSVRTMDIAERLVQSFTTNYISSGRKPEASVAQLSNANVQIRLTNINNIMSSKEFETWILSLCRHSFDIQLMPPKITKSSQKCILSFDTINAAIFVKQKLQNQSFRGFELYFTHWHVPRRNKKKSGPKTPVTPAKLQTNFGMAEMNGYDTAGISDNSPVSNSDGPLYLRDNTVPPPPGRAPPSVPTQSSQNTINCKVNDSCDENVKKSGPDSENQNQKTDFKMIEILPSLSVEQSLPQMAFINSLHLEIKRLQLMNEKVQLEKRGLLSELSEEKKFNQYMNEKYTVIYNNYVSLSQTNKVLLWNSIDIVQWVCSLENGWFSKYKDVLTYNMNQREMNGAMLSHITQIELHRMGVIAVNDQYLLLTHIKQLFHR